MRTLFASEKRCISRLYQMKWGRQIVQFPTVASETIVEPANPERRPWFNCDFSLSFIDWRQTRVAPTAAVCSVLPHALGAELFLVMERDTLSPTDLELFGGGAFSIAQYVSFVGVVEAAIQEATERSSQQEAAHRWKELMGLIPIQNSGFARLLIVGSDATFLYFPNETTPLMRGECLSLVQTDDREINCYVDGDQIVCFDGWVRTHVARTEQMLVALPADDP